MIAKDKAQDLVIEFYNDYLPEPLKHSKNIAYYFIDHIKDELSIFYNSIYTNDETCDIYEDTLQWWEDVRKEVEKI